MNKTKLLEGVPSWKILAISCFFLMFFAPVRGQVVISPTPIVGLQFSSTDVLNFSVINTSSQVLQVTYSAQLMDGRGRAVVRYASGVHQLSPGASSYTPTSFNIISTSWVNRTIQSIEQTSKFLPSGDYTYCIDIHCAATDKPCNDVIKPELDYISCADFRVEPTTPLLLSFPEDEAKLKDKRPNFSWIPPMPLGSNPNMRYTIKLVEMRDNQSAEDAIRRNRPLYEKEGINGLTLMYPNQLEDLKEAAHYAWQVSAHIGEQHIATSEVWEFEIIEEVVLGSLPKAKLKRGNYYFELDKGIAQFYFDWNNAGVNSTLTYTIYQAAGKQVADQSYFDPIQIHPGTNKVELPISEVLQLPEGTYFIEIVGEGGETWYHQFKLVKKSSGSK